MESNAVELCSKLMEIEIMMERSLVWEKLKILTRSTQLWESDSIVDFDRKSNYD